MIVLVDDKTLSSANTFYVDVLKEKDTREYNQLKEKVVAEIKRLGRSQVN